ncbi:cobalt-precorrin-5B (C(1))-methyltransferase CbiD [Clostridioides difficile]|uniref:Cobalt-precorrin-6A synthase n=1 Tax=Clostridioides difficile ATCC 9689 = DSM 1296 TaxID=1121308 RepID=A0AC59G3V8_CLODI|nr:cobalt-precorrin-5B (C(1))-methyltransferase CbiD [Clostridioides difficile]OFU03282.1 cobalt-precorrin-5B (C(1))-methyltransferase [Clostridium sp. HMSC19D07]OFU10474.1 cobalt-precorrin-5B (C(1))-methyltransferase [Clostridium sp. HMSC19C11]OFU31023.1 cobalt-precorrin-5B (C(1))-methyltransferase [Clostridium sp. HMSC19B12]AKP44344.1 cobalt-precorrin-6A synthase [Clostridioides difficile ATCC 9689 = DSM 1296]AQU08259.1 cobalt-precorrin-5B (C(1))-methyltransferase [Clostridioides difficile]
MEEYVYIDGKKYRRGYTTGSCATGASKAAVYMLITKNRINTINIDTPKGIPLLLKVDNINISDTFVECSIKKDGGDDIDATHTMDIYARAEIVAKNDKNKGYLTLKDIDSLSTNSECKSELYKFIRVYGGTGIGVVTKKGLSVDVGKPAINPTPLKMINHEIRKLIGDNFESILGNDKVLKITIFAPQGETVAKKTFNPRLGIVGGISIIGTTGIVEPMSDEGWKKSLSIELQMKKEQGLDKIILVPGNHGEQFIREKLNLDIKYVVRVSNFIGYMIKEAQRIGYKKILMAGHIGKFIKVSAGIFNTHSKVADARSEILVANLALMGARYEFLNKINQCVTTEEAVELINNSEYREVYNILSNKCRERVKQYLNEDSDDIDVEVIIFSMDKSLLGKSDNTDDLVEVFI